MGRVGLRLIRCCGSSFRSITPAACTGTSGGIIPEGSYGAGPVLICDRGTFEPLGSGDPAGGLREGNLKFRLDGKWLRGDFTLIKMRGPGREKAWLLIKKQDAHARPGWETPVLLTSALRKKLRVRPPACMLEE